MAAKKDQTTPAQPQDIPIPEDAPSAIKPEQWLTAPALEHYTLLAEQLKNRTDATTLTPESQATLARYCFMCQAFSLLAGNIKTMSDFFTTRYFKTGAIRDKVLLPQTKLAFEASRQCGAMEKALGLTPGDIAGISLGADVSQPNSPLSDTYSDAEYQA